MKILAYIHKELAVAFAIASGGMLVLCLPGAAVSAVNKLAGVDMSVLLTIMPLLLANLLPYLLPLGYLLALVSTYGRLAADNEWTAIRMAGIHPRALFLPALPLALVLAGVSGWFCSEGLPVMRRLQEQTAFAALRKTITNLSPGRTELHLGKFNLIAGARQGDDFLHAVIHIPSMKGGEAKTLAAQRVHFSFEGDDMFVQLRGARILFGSFDLANESPVFQLNLRDLQRTSENKYSSLRYRASTDLLRELAKKKLEPQAADVMRFEVHQRAAIASIYFVFLFLGLPLGLLMRRGTQLGALAVAVAIAILYYILAMRLGQQLATNHLMPPMLCAWTVNAIGLLVGAYLCHRAFRQ